MGQKSDWKDRLKHTLAEAITISTVVALIMVFAMLTHNAKKTSLPKSPAITVKSILLDDHPSLSRGQNEKDPAERTH